MLTTSHPTSGFVASVCLLRVLDERRQGGGGGGAMFPLIHGVLCFDTPLNGLARSMFVYGAFSNYHKVSNVFNMMTALSAAAPAALSRLAAGGVARRAPASSPAWKTWQLIALRTGTVGAIAAGGVAAYTHRRRIAEGVRSVRSLTRADVAQGYQQSVGALGQGLAYVNRGSVGASFAWLADHLAFVGALLRQNELARRLDRLAALRGGVGIAVVYASLGENGYWSGGYFVPERTFCAVPSRGGDGGGDGDADEAQPAARLFVRQVVAGASDEISAHVGMFKREKNRDYERMTGDAARRIVDWFNNVDAEVYDDPRFSGPAPAETAETEAISKAVDREGGTPTAEELKAAEQRLRGDTGVAPLDDVESDDQVLPDESPIDIAAAAALVPLPDDDDDDDDDTQPSETGGEADRAEQKQAYLRHLLGIAQQTGSSLRSYLPSTMTMPSVEMPRVPGMPSVSIPGLPAMPSVSVPRSMNPFLSSRKPAAAEQAEDGRAVESGAAGAGAGEDGKSVGGDGLGRRQEVVAE